MFFDIFQALCNKKGVSCKKAVEDIGLSNSISTKWKKTGATPKGETLNMIAAYFGVTVDYLLGAEKNPTAESSELDVKLEGIDFALYGEVKDLTEAQKRDVLRFVQFLKQEKKG